MTEIKEFAQRVERLCEFMLGRLYDEVGRNGSDEQKVLEDLRDDAANIQRSDSSVNQILIGLKDYMGGLPPETKES